MEYFAVIDTETNWNNKVMSIGIVIAAKNTFEMVDDLYFIFTPEHKVGGMFSMVLPIKGRSPRDVLLSRKKSMEKVKVILETYQINELFAYNASFDKNLLKELDSYKWFDIMRIAAYKQLNEKIPDNIECYKTGKMKRNHGVEPMMQLLSGNHEYREVHNALYDAMDELEIMRLLGKPIEEYHIAQL